VAYSIIAISIAFHKPVVTSQPASIRMLAYGAFKIQATKVKKLIQKRTPPVYYKMNKGPVVAIKNYTS
jgi:hypothetical protein